MDEHTGTHPETPPDASVVVVGAGPGRTDGRLGG